MTAKPFEDAPEPLVPAHVDLTCYDFMPLFGDTLRTSNLNASGTPEEKWAALQLWWSSWWQKPAASLPNNEIELAGLAGCKTMRAWRRVRAVAMSKWLLCSDNRWYHPFLAPQAIRAFEKKKTASIKGALGGKKLWENKKGRHASANASATHEHSSGNGTGNASAIEKDGTGSSNRSELNTPPTPPATATSTPRAAAHSTAKAQQQLAQQRASPGTPMPKAVRDALPENIKRAIEYHAAPQPELEQHQGDHHADEGHETLDS